MSDTEIETRLAEWLEDYQWEAGACSRLRAAMEAGIAQRDADDAAWQAGGEAENWEQLGPRPDAFWIGFFAHLEGKASP
jgi:hypothetical protein